METLNKENTHFGYKKINKKEKEKNVKKVFDSVASKYDIMNDIMSFGIHRIWKKKILEICNIKKNDNILDLASGTGDLAIKMGKKLKNSGKLVIADINKKMLNKAVQKNKINQNIYYIQTNAENLPFKKNIFNCITISFGLRNITDKKKALKNILDILKPNGKLIILEFSEPTNKIFKNIYDIYSFNIIPKIGEIVCNDSLSYKYLIESIRIHPNQEDLLKIIKNIGFRNSHYINLTGGIVTLHIGYK